LTIERSIVFKTMDRQCESFSRIFSSATGWIKVLYLFGTLGLHRLINENSEIFFKNFQKIQNFPKISKFSKIFKNLSFHKIS
jgi:hypothetical protein